MEMEKEFDILTSTKISEDNFEEIYIKYYPSMFAYARFFVVAEDAEETVQDVMVWLWKNKDKVNITSDFQSYLLRSVRNGCLNRITQGQAKQRLQKTISDKLQAFYEDTDNYVIEELSQNIDAALKKLPESYRIAFMKSRSEGKSYPEIATELNVSVKTVEYRISQALKILRTELKDYLPVIIWVILFNSVPCNFK
jgi:RNA polymerase sigma-70 factor (ECF subfamily)